MDLVAVMLVLVGSMLGLHYGTKVFLTSKRPRIQRTALAAAFFLAGLVIPPLSLVLFIEAAQWLFPGPRC